MLFIYKLSRHMHRLPPDKYIVSKWHKYKHKSSFSSFIRWTVYKLNFGMMNSNTGFVQGGVHICVKFWKTYSCNINACEIAYYSDVTMSAMVTTGVAVVCSTVCSGADQRKHQSSAPIAFVKGTQRWPMDSLYKEPVTRNNFHLMT